MNRDGRNEGGYRCSGAKGGLCWNKATALRDDVHRRLQLAICNRLLAISPEFPGLVVGLNGLLATDAAERQRQLEELVQRQQVLEGRCDSLAAAIEFAKEAGGSLERLTDRLLQAEGELARTRAEIDRLRDPANEFKLPMVPDLAAARDSIVQQLQTFDREVGALLEQLTGRIRAVPYQQFASNKVVLRAAFELDLRVLLPRALTLQLSSAQAAAIAPLFPKILMLVVLFEPSTGPRHGLRAIAMREKGMSFKEIGLELGFQSGEAIRRAEIAVSFGRKLRGAGLTDPYIELSEAPAAASRWRTHVQHGQPEPKRNEGEVA